MDYTHKSIEEKWQSYWSQNKTFEAKVNDQPKYYGLTMFPYPSGAGLHVGHPLGYIASDIYARYKRHLGFNVLHPMGYDSFGLPAEQYAIQTGQHPAITTKENIARYREQLDQIGFAFDWTKEVKTSNPDYYKWTQWIFKQLFDSWYNNETNKAERISTLIEKFTASGNAEVNAVSDQEIIFSAQEWSEFSEKEQSDILMNYRLTFLADSWVNWCPELGTVLANDEIKDGVSERGGHPVEQKLMRQWSMRITAYAERLLQGSESIDWTDAIKEQQRNWIGKSAGASVEFKVENSDKVIEVFTTRPDTIYGVNFVVLAPEHEYVSELTTAEQKDAVEAYVREASLKSERDRQSDVKNISGVFTGAYAIHPFTGEKVAIWLGDYVLASYGTGAVMAVPCGDQRDWDFANHFNIEIKNIFEDIDISEAAYTEKTGKIADSDFLNGLPVKKAIKTAIYEIEKRGLGKGKTNYRLRDAVFSRQRYWGEPFPVYYKNEIPTLVDDAHLPVELPEVNNYLPTADGEPPLGNASVWSWDEENNKVVENSAQNGSSIWPLELNTMPGWAGSSWYFLRYMDPQNHEAFVNKEKVEYWKQVDLYIGGSEHATGHLLYARFWTMFLNDMGYIDFSEPFQKMINQGMILGKSAIAFVDENNTMVSFDSISKEDLVNYREVRIWIDLIDGGDNVDVARLKTWQPQFADMNYQLNGNGEMKVKREVDKMSKRWFNVVNPDDLCERYGADTLRCYEMFLGPLEQAKPWDTQGINGVQGFLKKMWRLFFNDGVLSVSEEKPSKEEYKALHKAIKKVREDLDRFSFNTCVSTFMIAVNELTDLKCNKREILEDLVRLVSPFAPHITEELWSQLGHEASVSSQGFPEFVEEYLVESDHEYPISFNGKMRFKLKMPLDLSKEEIEKTVLAHEQSVKYIDGKPLKKVIVVPGKIVNIVV
ncbi:MAG: leucine--tRNA ligase [Crocinitomicaceae bacterium]|nr:leucine--tRNA ligase [Crocinitomicaceae bacterium]